MRAGLAGRAVPTSPTGHRPDTAARSHPSVRWHYRPITLPSSFSKYLILRVRSGTRRRWPMSDAELHCGRFRSVLARLRLIVVLLLVALPLQGIASTTRALCDHASTSAPIPLAAAASGHDVDQAGRSGHPGMHEHGTQAAYAAGHQVGDGAAEASGDAVAHYPMGLDPGSCAHCAACCVGAALPGAVTALPAVSASETAFAFASAAAPSRPFDGPERPPRTA